MPARSSRAQGTAESAQVASNGVNVIETSGVYPAGTAGADHYLDGGANNTYPSFDVLDFNTSSYGLSFPVASISSLTLTLTEAQDSASKAGLFNIYLTEDTSTIATAYGGSPLMYQSANAPGGVGTQLGTSSTFFNIGSFTSDASTTGSTVDTFTLTLSAAAQSYFISQLNSTSGGDLRLVIASNDANGYATFLGNGTKTITVPAASQPTLSFNATFNQATLNWTPGGSTTGGAGTWLPANTSGDTSWSGGPWNNTTAVFAGTGGAVAIGTGGVTAQSIQFNATGYTVGTTTGPALMLVSANGTTAPVVQVTNATDTATINAPIAGTTGLNKLGAGTLVLGGTNTFTGGTTVSAGTLQIGADANLGDASGAVTLNGGTLHATSTLTTARAFNGSGGLQVDAGNSLNISGIVQAVNLTLPGAGTVALTNTAGSLGGNASNAVTGTLTFNTAGATLTASGSGSVPSDGQGIINLGNVTAAQASGTVTLAANVNLNGTATFNVAGGTLSVSGGLGGTAAVAKTGAGTLVLGGENASLAGTGTTATSFRQGTAGTTPATGGTISIAATNPDPGNALGTGVFDANGGTLSNDTGAPVTLAVSGISVGAQNAATTPGGLVFAGSGANPAITVTGAISLYNGATAANAYVHTITFNVPTTFTGVLTASANTTTSRGLTFAGTSTLTLAGTTANTLFEPIIIATTGTNAGVIAAADGTFAANTSITINPGARLTISTGTMAGTVNTINDAALVSFAATGGTFGRLLLNMGTAQETVGGLYLAASDGTLPAGYQPAGTYGATGSGAQYIDNTLFSGTGVINDLADATAVPEPSTWMALLAGLALLARRFVRRGQRN